MTIERARDLVYRYADFLADKKPLIGDASILPCTRTELRNAFQVYLSWMYSERARNPSAFEANGYGETLRAAESCYCMVDDFHDIAPQDKADVERINASIAAPSDIGAEALELMRKYPPGGARRIGRTRRCSELALLRCVAFV